MAEPNNSPGGPGLMDKVKDGAVSQLARQKDRTSDGIGSVVSAVRQSTRQLRDQQHDTIAEYVEEAAAQLDRFSNTLKEKNVGELLEDAQRFARRNPALFVGGAFALGILSARFFKSSRDRSGNGDDWRDRFAPGGRDYSGDRVSQSPGRQYGPGDVDRRPTGALSYDTGRS
jgi:hypothetical protein